MRRQCGGWGGVAGSRDIQCKICVTGCVAKFQTFSPVLSTGPHLALPSLDQAAGDLLSLTQGKHFWDRGKTCSVRG